MKGLNIMNGQIKNEDEIYCPECGRPVKKNAVICISFRVQIKEIKTSLKKETTAGNPNAKSKTAAIVITIAHFLKSYGSLFIFIGFAAVWIWAIVDNAIKPDSFYDNYPYD